MNDISRSGDTLDYASVGIMPVRSAFRATRARRVWAISKTLLLVIGYFLLTEIFIQVLEANLNPPGFTGKGAYSMLAIFLGAFHLAGKLKRPWAFLLFGALGAMLLLPEYHGGPGWSEPTTTIRGVIIGWSIYVVAMALLTRTVAKVRWRLIQEVTRKSPLCMRCRYDLRASQTACPECGTAFDLNDTTTYLATVPHWDFRWLARRVLMLLAAVALPLAILYGGLYWRSQQPAIATVEGLGASVDTESDLPPELRYLPQAIPQVALDKLFAHAVLVSWGGQCQDGQIAFLKNLPDLTEIHINGAPITGTGFRPLAGMAHFERLYVPGSSINDSGLANIGALSRLTQLQLCGTGITDAGIGHLKSLQRLEALWLDKTSVSDVGLLQLVNLPNLAYLDLTGTHVTAEGISQFKALRPAVRVDWP